MELAYKKEEKMKTTFERAMLAMNMRAQIETLRIWDSGVTIDRYTIVWPNGSYLDLSEDPFHPRGVCQHGEGALYDPAYRLIGGNLYSYLGKEIQFSNLPEDCQEAVILECSGAILAEDLAKIDEESGEDPIEGGQSA